MVAKVALLDFKGCLVMLVVLSLDLNFPEHVEVAHGVTEEQHEVIDLPVMQI
jgi:hypothetical protein